jgi:hypothetical protein
VTRDVRGDVSRLPAREAHRHDAREARDLRSRHAADAEVAAVDARVVPGERVATRASRREDVVPAREL